MSAMSPVKVGVLGTGWGELQIAAFQRVKNVEVVAVGDLDRARAEQIAKQFKIPRAFTNFQLLITDPDVNLVSIATPPDQHQAACNVAIAAGKHVLCEKPLALNAREARAMLAQADARGVVHAVDFEMRFLPAFQYAKELIDEDYLGQLFRVDVTMTMEQAWNVHGNWAADDARGGGVLMEVGSHFLDALLWWFGDVCAVLASRRANFPTPTSPSPASRGGQADDAFWCVMEFERGGEAVLSFITGARHDPGWTITAVGSVGTLVIKSGELWGRRDGDLHMAPLAIPQRLEQKEKPNDPLLWGMVRLIERVVAKIQGGESLPFPTFRDGVAVAEIIDAVRLASDERRWTPLD